MLDFKTVKVSILNVQHVAGKQEQTRYRIIQKYDRHCGSMFVLVHI